MARWRSPRWRALLTITATVMLLAPVVSGIPSASAAGCTLVGDFEIDGNMAVDCATDVDWANAVGVEQTVSGGTYSTSSKDSDPPSTWTSAGSQPPKADFARVYALTKVESGDYYAYVAWERSAGTGTGGYAIEIDNAGTNVAADGTPQPDRSEGGFVFHIELANNKPPALDEVCAFSGANYPGTCNSSPDSQYFAIATNSGTITDSLQKPAEQIGPGQFLEVGVNISELTQQYPSCPAASTVASLYLRSLTGQISNGNLKGYVDPLKVSPNSTCVAPTITTTATPGNTTIDKVAVAAPGTAQQDVVTVTGDATHPAPSGKVDFYLCGPNTSAGSGCATGGAKIGTETLTQNAASSTATSGSTSPTDPGVYCWRAEFTPTGVGTSNPFLPATHTNADSECFTVAHATPTITTSIGVTTVPASAVEGSLGLTTLDDTATLAGVYPDADLSGPKETVTFTLYGPFPSTPTSASCIAAGAPVAHTVTVGLTRKDSTTWTAATPTAYTPAAAGYYTWTASYSGDDINEAVSDGCAQASETGQIVGPAVAVKKVASPASVGAGDQIAFDINLENTGSGTATGVTVTDVLPTLVGGGVWALDATPGYDCRLDAPTATVTCSVGNLNPTGGWATIATVHAMSTVADCGHPVTNTATLTTTNGGSGSSSDTVTVSCAQLTIDKTPDPASGHVSVGSDIGYTITVTNTSPTVAAKTVTVTDPLPSGAGLSWSVDSVDVGSVSTPGACTIHTPGGGAELDCTLASLAPGSALAVHISSSTGWSVGTKSCGSYSNTASVTAGNVAGVINSMPAVVDVECPDLAIAKTTSHANVDAGDPIDFTITATNSGNGDATGALISDTLPVRTGLNWRIDSHTGPLTCGIAAGELTCTGTLDAHATETVKIVSTTTYASCAAISNTATLTANNDPNAPTDSATTHVRCADVTVAKKADATSVSVGTDIGFTVTATNGGAGAAHGVDVEDALPTGPGITWSIDAGNTSGPLVCTITSGTLSCTGDLAATGNPDAVETVHVTSPTSYTDTGGTTVNSCLGGNGTGRYDNTATLTWTDGPPGTRRSNTASEQVDCPQLAVTKVADAATAPAGSPIGFRITVTNTGSGAATNAILTDALPTGTGVTWSIVSAHTTAPGCVIAVVAGGQDLTCAIGTLAAGASEHVHVTSATTAASCGSYDNTATLITGNTPDATGSATTTVICPVLTLIKTADAPSVSVGSPLGFTVTVDNAAPAPASGVVINDALPGGPGLNWSIDSVTLNGSAPASNPCTITGSAPTQTLTCDGGGTPMTLAAGDVLVVHVVSPTAWAPGPVAVNSCLGGTAKDGVYENTASVTASGLKPTPQMTDSAAEGVLCPQLGITKHAAAASIDAGSDAGYQVTVDNGGPGAATGVVLSDVLPRGPGIDWSISSVTIDGTAPASNPCTISGTAPSQTLTCGGQKFALAATDVLAVSVTSQTSGATCNAAAGTTATLANTAGVTAANTPDAPTASASVQVNCAAVTLAKTADASAVDAGSPIGYTITATNNGPGTAKSVTVTDPLPTGTGITWTITAAGPALTCVIAAGSLTCTGDLVPGASDTVHVSSPTSAAGCGSYANTAVVDWSTAAAPVAASATEQVRCPVTPSSPALVFGKSADAPVASAGSPIGFVLAVANHGTDSALDAVVNDPLPAGNDIDWSLESVTGAPAGACTISGAVGSQVLNCALGTVAPGADVRIHVTSGTDVLSCAGYANSATLTATNAPELTATANTTVSCAVDAIRVRADAAQVASGQPIGFRLTGSNVSGTVLNAIMTSKLPAGQDVFWSIDGPANALGVHSFAAPVRDYAARASAPPTGCAIAGSAGAQVLTCAIGSLDPGAAFTVHISSSTTANSCKSYTDTAVLTADNAEPVSDQDVTQVLCVAPVQVSRTPPAPAGSGTPLPPLASTGSGPVSSELGLALGLLLLGGLTLMVAQRRRPRRH